MVEHSVTTITDPETCARILEVMRESKEDAESRKVANQRSDELFQDIINKFPSGTYFDRNQPTNRVRATPITMRKLTPSDMFPLPENHSRFYGDLEFKYSSHDDGFDIFSRYYPASFKSTFTFIVCAHALFDTRAREVDDQDPYCSKWISVGIPGATLAALIEEISGFASREGYSLTTTNFEVTNDGKYVTTVAGLKTDPRFVEITDDLEQHYIGDLKNVYESRSRNGVHKGFLIFDPYLTAVVPDNDPVARPECHLKFRLLGIRSFGESPAYETYFPNLNRMDF